jgi:hypothetical protein
MAMYDRKEDDFSPSQQFKASDSFAFVRYESQLFFLRSHAGHFEEDDV